MHVAATSDGAAAKSGAADLDQLAIDWSRPWFAPYRTLGSQAFDLVQGGMPVHKALQCLSSTLLSVASDDCDTPSRLPTFVDAAALPRGVPDETHIHDTRCVPTRHNLHDFFNGLVWLHHPVLKWRLNALQASELACHGAQVTRGALRDALTLFDENGAVVTLPPQAADALRQRRWHDAFVTHRLAWHDDAVQIVGHALLEKLAVAPRRSITAHALLQSPTALTEDEWARKPFAPLPVMGVPGWHHLQDAAFYGDARVFRESTSLTSTVQPS